MITCNIFLRGKMYYSKIKYKYVVMNNGKFKL